MSTTFRAAYYVQNYQSTGILLTSEEHAGLSDEDIRAEAKAEALRAGVIGTDAYADQVTEEDFDAGLVVGDYRL